jgi:methionyl-tRNA formyltransferase
VKILLCTMHDLIGAMMLNLILPRIPGEHSVSVLLANRRRPNTAAIPALNLMKLIEQDIPARLLFPLLDLQAGTGAGPTAPRWLSFEGLSRRYGMPITNAGHIAQFGSLTSLVTEAAPDLIVSFQFGFLFKPEALAVPRIGALNLHSGALPERAGANPTFWCMKEGDSHLGCTLHWIDHGIDTGDVVEIRRIPIDYTRSVFANLIENFRNGAAMIGDAIGTLSRGGVLPAVPQDADKRRYVATPTVDDFVPFHAAGLRMVDAGDVLALLSAFLPDDASEPA